MQRTLDVILTAANFKSAQSEGGEKRIEGNENTVREIAQYETKRSSRAAKFPQFDGRVERGKF